MRPVLFLRFLALLAATAAALGVALRPDLAPRTAVLVAAGTLVVLAVVAWQAARWLARAAALQLGLEGELDRLATCDPLTGLANRRAFDDALAVQIARGERDGERGALLVLELDGLEDRCVAHGRPAGDALLRTIGEVVRDRVRRTDVAARIADDRVAIIAPHTDVAGGITLGFALLDAIREQATTVSVGLAALDRPDPHAEADAALRVARRAGGDRLLVAQEPLPA